MARQLPPLVGRDTDLLTLTAQLCRSDTHLSTVTGPGGVGKSRLAAAVADEMTRLNSVTVAVVDLHGATTAEEALRAIADSVVDNFGCLIGERANVQEIAEKVPDGDVLLILDGCEQVTENLALMVRELLSWHNEVISPTLKA
ncbi:AAA family ATPase [Umezawaea sp. Da 62-37]|uniref:AAA family ATPase n=1 Tax=Umezawaea sp. Da 62-37 TaxID=3075927 RepID=UPI0028F6D832|nr:AAA family ATPase [Umezawaea sp. Da 62-37]WNV88999.1 hypothetical protein RM788_12045 [Umezawaea sp. Da 62-37]